MCKINKMTQFSFILMCSQNQHFVINRCETISDFLSTFIFIMVHVPNGKYFVNMCFESTVLVVSSLGYVFNVQVIID